MHVYTYSHCLIVVWSHAAVLGCFSVCGAYRERGDTGMPLLTETVPIHRLKLNLKQVIQSQPIPLEESGELCSQSLTHTLHSNLLV